MSRPIRILAAAAIVLGLSLAGTPAVAVPTEGTPAATRVPPVKAAQGAAKLARLAIAADSRVLNHGEGRVRVRVPNHPRQQVVLERLGAAPKTLAVSLPTDVDVRPAEVKPDGSILFDGFGPGDVDVEVRVYEDASVSVQTVIPNRSAPSTYTYRLGLPDHFVATTNPDGSIFFTSEDGTWLGGVAAPWAVDAKGVSLPTSYRLDGANLIQQVLFDESTAYPVVADPWLGLNLFSSITVDSYNLQPRVNLDLSWWGRAVYSGAAQGGGVVGLAAGQAILNTAGWGEAWDRNSTVRSALDKPSQRQQFECHALGALFAGQWNLEKFRPNRTAHWSYGVAIHHCNWTTSYRY